MIIKNQNLKIATILPYKENYSIDKASAASLWVAEFFKNSKFKKENIIFGNTKSKQYLTVNYKNIILKNLYAKFKSSTKEEIILPSGSSTMRTLFPCSSLFRFWHFIHSSTSI